MKAFELRQALEADGNEGKKGLNHFSLKESLWGYEWEIERVETGRMKANVGGLDIPAWTFLPV